MNTNEGNTKSTTVCPAEHDSYQLFLEYLFP